MILKDALIHLLGGYTTDEFNGAMYRADRRWEELYADREEVIKKLTVLSAQTPEDCKRGAWCDDCVFSGKHHFWLDKHTPYRRKHAMTYCMRGDACKSLRFKEDDEQ